MKLYIVRHAVAIDRDEFALQSTEDSLRPITAKGEKKFSRLVQFLKPRIDKLDLIISSPYKRAYQTAEVLRKMLKPEECQLDERLVPYTKLIDTIEMIKQSEKESMAIVGHEPHLSALISNLLSGKDKSFIDLKKGSITCLEFSGSIGAGQGILKWYVTPGLG